MNKKIFKKKIKIFKLLEKMKKRDLSKEIYNLNLINSEIGKTDSLIEKIDFLISENTTKYSKTAVLASAFKDKSKIINVLNNQKIIARNKKDFLLEQKRSANKKFSKKLLEKNKVRDEIKNKILSFDNYNELKIDQENRKAKDK